MEAVTSANSLASRTPQTSLFRLIVVHCFEKVDFRLFDDFKIHFENRSPSSRKTSEALNFFTSSLSTRSILRIISLSQSWSIAEVSSGSVLLRTLWTIVSLWSLGRFKIPFWIASSVFCILGECGFLWKLPADISAKGHLPETFEPIVLPSCTCVAGFSERSKRRVHRCTCAKLDDKQQTSAISRETISLNVRDRSYSFEASKIVYWH